MEGLPVDLIQQQQQQQQHPNAHSLTTDRPRASSITSRPVHHQQQPPPPPPQHAASTIGTSVKTGTGAGTGAGAAPSNPHPMDPRDLQNARALQVLERVKEKLTGRDFKPSNVNNNSGISNAHNGTTIGGGGELGGNAQPPHPTPSQQQPRANGITTAVGAMALNGDGINNNNGTAATTVAASGVNDRPTTASTRKTTPFMTMTPTSTELPVAEQVEKLIKQATEPENLCQHYIGWCSFW